MERKARSLFGFASAAALVCAAYITFGGQVAASASSGDAAYVRDPFWPVGYDPGADASAAAAAAAARAAAAKPAVENQGPVTEEEWAAAQDALPRPSGIFQTLDPNTKKPAYKLMLDRKSYFVGDSIFQTNNAVEFVWKVDSITFTPAKYDVSRVSSTRVVKHK